MLAVIQTISTIAPLAMQGVIITALMAIGSGGTIASLIALIVGLLRKRRSVWRPALVSCLFCVSLLGASSVWGATLLFRAAKHQIAQAMSDNNSERQGSPEKMHEWFENITRIPLPSEAVYMNGQCVDELNFRNYFLEFTIPASFRPKLDSAFEPAQWQDVEADLTPWSLGTDWRSQLPFWDVSHMQGKLYFQRTMTDEMGRVTFKIVICLDPTTNLVHFVAKEIHD